MPSQYMHFGGVYDLTQVNLEQKITDSHSSPPSLLIVVPGRNLEFALCWDRTRNRCIRGIDFAYTSQRQAKDRNV